MADSEETLKQEPTLADLMKAISSLEQKFEERLTSLEQKFDEHRKESNAQFEAIREGIVHNGVAFDRLQAVVYNLRADVMESAEEARKGKLALK